MPQPTSPSLSSFKPQRGMDCTDDDRPCELTTKQGSKTTTQLEQKKIQTAVTVERHVAIQEILRDPKASEAQKRSKIQSRLGITPILLKKQQDDDSEDSPPTFLGKNAWFEQDNDDLDSRNEPYTIESTKQRESTTIQQRGIVIAQEHDDISENQQGKDDNFYLEQKKVSPAPANPKYLPMTPRCKRCPWGRH